MSDEERLERFVCDALKDIDDCEIDTGIFSPGFRPLAESVKLLVLNMREVYDFTASISDGNLTVSVPARQNLYAGPSKDLYYKLKHLTWQAKEVAKGDYNQRVDFLGEFSESFNYMVSELELREAKIKEHARREIDAVTFQNEQLKRQMERQKFHYYAYRDYTKSFSDFRMNYKKMMGEVYDLFSRHKYEEGRLLIAKINDKMSTGIIINKDYSNNEILNIMLTDIANVCHVKHIPFSGNVYLPPKKDDEEYSINRIFLPYINLFELIISILEIKDHVGKTLNISSTIKNGWFSFGADYYASGGIFPNSINDCLYPESVNMLDIIKKNASAAGDILCTEYDPENMRISIALHICRK